MSLYTWRNRLLLDLPFRAAQHDAVNTQSLNVGRAGAALNADFGAGAAEPTKLGYRRGYSFDGGDYMQCSAGYQNTTGLISVMLTWSGSALAVDGLFSWETVGGDTVALILTTATDVRFYTGGAAAANAATVVAATWAADRQGTFVGVHDGTNTLAYVNGQFAAVAATPLAPAATSQPMWIGQRTNTASGFNGNIYHAGMADFALSGTQVKQYHNTMMRRFHQV